MHFGCHKCDTTKFEVYSNYNGSCVTTLAPCPPPNFPHCTHLFALVIYHPPPLPPSLAFHI